MNWNDTAGGGERGDVLAALGGSGGGGEGVRRKRCCRAGCRWCGMWWGFRGRAVFWFTPG